MARYFIGMPDDIKVMDLLINLNDSKENLFLLGYANNKLVCNVKEEYNPKDIYCKSIFYKAITTGSSKAIIAHNRINLSIEELILIEKTKWAGGIINIEVLDYILFYEDFFISTKQLLQKK